MSQPYLAKDSRGITTLYVENKPFFCLAGEIHNSSSSCAEYMEAHVWPHIAGKGLNTVLLPVAWETVEPAKGEYVFDIVDKLISQGKERGVKLIFLWFGLWKNAESFCVPAWVKKDPATYFPALQYGGIRANSISPFCKEAVAADARAFAALMQHLAQSDKDHTVIM
ncbi:MAG: beta-galactosidase, partial [Lachnospiraceae bacterium]|nr:beta-galactosidase [Lachnospiraceae bacterium]